MGKAVLEDALEYLPRGTLQRILKKQSIYDSQCPSDRLYLVAAGRVKIAHTLEDGARIVARFVSAEGLFNESVLVPDRPQNQTAIALENTTVMSWTAAEVEQRIESEPRLGLALMQYTVRNCIELQDRIESMACYHTPQRVMLALINLGQQLGTRTADGSKRLAWLSHLTIAEYVGTSREIVSVELNNLRRRGLLRYSRRYTDVYTEALEDTLRADGVLPGYSSRSVFAAPAAKISFLP